MMAEFQEVMKQWRRFCESHSNCGECEFDGKRICGEAHISNVPYSDLELRIMAWAAEHPEPVYPTWGEWLMEQMVIAERMRPKYDYTNGERTYELERTGEYIAIDSEMKKHIPADIAEKLGIEPKEG